MIYENGERVEDALHQPHGQNGATDVFQEQQPPPGTQDPRGLGYGPALVGNVTERERGDHRVEGGV